MQKRFVSIWFPYLATDWFITQQPELKNEAFVIKSSSHNSLVVSAATANAQAQGICIGMALADARAIVPGLLAFDEKPELSKKLLLRIAHWCIRLTPLAAPDAPDGILLDATGCSHLWGGDEAYINDITKRLAARGYTARVAIADTITVAWAMARYSKQPMIAVTGSGIQPLLHMPAAALRLDTATIERLHKLGLHTINHFIAMPHAALRRRFGAQIIKRLAQASGKEDETFTPIIPLQPHEERLPCVEPIATLAGIEIALELLLQNLCNRLCAEGKGIRNAYLRCYRIDNTVQEIEIATTQASHHAAHLFYLFSLQFSKLEPKSGIELFALEAKKVEDYKPKQVSLWETNGTVDQIKLAEFIDRIAGKFGSNCIHHYIPAEHHLPERSYKKSASLQEQKSTSWITCKQRPLRVLALPVKIEVTAPVPDYPPMNFRHKGKLHIITKADGPERIEQEWWIADGEHRDYYCVEDENGFRYWLFRLGHYTGDKSHQWFLHGFFA